MAARRAGVRPRLPQALDPAPAPMEHVGSDRARLPQGLAIGPQFVDQRGQGVGEEKHPAPLVFRRAGFKAGFLGLPIDVPPLQRQDLALDAPAGHVGEPDDRLKRGRQGASERHRASRRRRIPSGRCVPAAWDLRHP